MLRSDAECVRLALDGHPEEFCELVTRYEHAVVSYLSGRLRDAESAEEAAQEAFVRSYFSLARLRKPHKFFSWLLGIAERVAREEFGRRKRRAGSHELTSAEAPPATAERDIDLERAVAELAEPYREVVLLRFYAGLSCGEIAAKLSMPLGTVTKRLSRAYADLREVLGDKRGQLGREDER